MKGWYKDSYRHSLAARRISTARIPAGTLRPSSFWASIKEGAISGSKWGAAPSKTSIELKKEQLSGEKYPDIVGKTYPTEEEEYKAALEKSLGSMTAASQRVTYFNELAASVKPRVGERLIDFRSRIDDLKNIIPHEAIFKTKGLDKNGNPIMIYADDYVEGEIIKLTGVPMDDTMGDYVYTGTIGQYQWMPDDKYREFMSGSEEGAGDDLKW